MASPFQSIKEMYSQKKPIAPGLYCYQSPPAEESPYRLQLRVEKDGKGVLVVNAATILHLNQTAAEFAYHIIQGTDFDTAIDLIAHRYNISSEQIVQDYAEFQNQIQTLIQTPDLDPVMYLGIEREDPYATEISAPYRLDCALTYAVNMEDPLESALADRVDRELTTEEWLKIIEKACEIGIPHILFTGGEPTLRTDLPELIQKAEDLGMVTGLLSDGIQLSNDSYRQTLLASGLDHLMLILDPDNLLQWAALTKILPEDLFTTVHLTLKPDSDLEPVIKRLKDMGANALSLSASDPNLAGELENVRNYAAVLQLELIWDMPVPYSRNNPVSLELAESKEQEPPQGAGKAWLYVEPDGDVLPAQGQYDQVLGNLLTDPWDRIWQNH